MKLLIRNKTDESKIIISFNKEVMEIYTKEEDANKNTNWTTKGINDFIIKLATAVPKGEKIELDFDSSDESMIYQHIVTLFNSFINEFNASEVAESNRG